MTSSDNDNQLQRLVHEAIDSQLPLAGVEQRVLQSAWARIKNERPARRVSWSPIRTTLGSALTALAVIALIGGALGFTLSLKGHVPPVPAKTPLHTYPTRPPVVAPITPTPIPAGARYFSPAAVSFATASDGWTVGRDCDVQGQCALSVKRTTNGGAQWESVHFPVNLDVAGVNMGVTAASSGDAWIWGSLTSGQGVLAATHNAGQSWQQLSVGNAQVADVGIARGTAWAVTTCSTATPCTARLFAQPVGGRTFADLGPLPAALQGPTVSNSAVLLSELVRSGGRAWVLDANQQRPALVRTDNAGHTWVSLRLPCVSGATMVLGASSADFLMLACANGGAWPTPQEVWTSNNGGSLWTLRSREWYTFFSPPQPNVGSINSGGAPIRLVTLSNETAWMANDREDDLVTHNGGATWIHAALPSDYFGGGGGAEGLGFEDALHGWTFNSAGIWTTSDGGVTWRQEPAIGP